MTATPAPPPAAFPWERLVALCRRRARAYRLPRAAEPVVDHEDVAQDLCAHLLRAWPTYDADRGSVAAWASGHIRRALADMSRSWNRQRRGGGGVPPASLSALESIPERNGEEGGGFGFWLPDPKASDPFDAAVRAEALERAQRSVTPRQWTILLARFSGLTLEEAATVDARRCKRRRWLTRQDVRRLENDALGVLTKHVPGARRAP